MKQGKIINPVSGRWVLRSGAIGKKILQQGSAFTSKTQYKRVVQLWDWWSQCTDSEIEKVAQSKYWDSMLKDQLGSTNVYPIYLKSYQQVLKNAHNFLNK